MNFRDRLLMDVHTVFLAPDGFGEQVEIEGKTVCAVVEDIQIEYPAALTDGLRQRRKRVSLAKSDAPDMLEIGRVLVLADEEWIVEVQVEELGMVTLTLCKEVY